MSIIMIALTMTTMVAVAIVAVVRLLETITISHTDIVLWSNFQLVDHATSCQLLINFKAIRKEIRRVAIN